MYSANAWRMQGCGWMLMVALGLGGLWSACKDSTLDARKLANALADEFTDGLVFEDSTLMAEDPPAATETSPDLWRADGPRAVAPPALGVPESVDYGVSFDLALTASQVVDDGSVVGVIAHVQQANRDDSAGRYFQITPPAASFVGTQVTLRAQVIYSPELAGNAFHVRLALLRSDGGLGPYRDWNLITYPLVGESTRVPMCVCEQTTTFGPNGYSLYEDSNLTLNPECGADGINEELNVVRYFYGDDDQSYDSDPCGQFAQMYGARNGLDGFQFPTATRLRPLRFDSGGLTEACWIQIDCP